MAKNIVLLSDGTGNSSAQLLKTNVWRIYESLLLDDPASQVACYDDGVGTSGFKPLAVLGGAFGIGLKRNVLRLYRFLCEHYQPGDRIYLFGFSRGAFTVRVLNSLICSQGIIKTPESGLPRPDEKPASREAVFGGALARQARWAYREFRKQFNQTGVLVTMARMLRDVVFRATEFGKRRYHATDNHAVDAIEFIGVWDTVDAYGLPVDELTAGVDRWVWPLSMPDLTLPRQVKRACHVLAMDDERNTFHPVLWDESEEAIGADGTNVRDERLTQVWFAGMHSNVGGGYPDDALSMVSLKWMTDQVHALANPLVFSPGLLSHHLAKQDPLGRIYDSRRGVKGYYRYNPRRIEWLTNGLEHETRFWNRPGLLKLAVAWDRAINWISKTLFRRPPRVAPTVTIARPKIHESVFKRIASAPEAYAPIVMPQTYSIVRSDGTIAPADDLAESADARAVRARAQEAAWNLVWYRRAVYFAAVALTVALVLRPFREDAADIRQLPAQGPIGRAVESLGGMLPSLASPLVEYYAALPNELLMLLLPIVAMSLIGRRLQAAACGRMRRIWLRTAPPPGAHLDELMAPQGFLLHLRSSDAYQAIFAILRRRILPTVTGIGVLLWLAGAANRLPFEVANLAGAICAPSAAPQELARGAAATTTMHANNACNATGVTVTQGEQYLISIASIPEPFQDGTVKVEFPRGFSTWSPGLSPAQRAIFSLAAPFRRSWSDRWFAPTARVGHRGAEHHFLKDGAKITAQSTGELFLFVNDAVLPVGPGPFGWSTAYYDNNKGLAEIQIRHKPR